MMNSKPLFSLLLASQSPRRKQLLESAGFRYRTVLPQTEELIPDKGKSNEVAIENARLKGKSVASQCRKDEVLVSADTIVVLDRDAIGKPVDRADAKQILSRLSGKTHTVVSGLYLFSPTYGELALADESDVTFRVISPEEIEQYTLLKEPYDKAGAYAVQGASGLFIDGISGSFSNVMGLPLELLIRSLARLTERSVFELFERK